MSCFSGCFTLRAKRIDQEAMLHQLYQSNQQTNQLLASINASLASTASKTANIELCQNMDTMGDQQGATRHTEPIRTLLRRGAVCHIHAREFIHIPFY